MCVLNTGTRPNSSTRSNINMTAPVGDRCRPNLMKHLRSRGHSRPARIALLLLCQAFSAMSCQAPIGLRLREAGGSKPWPQQLAGRQLQSISSGYVLYANDAQAAGELQRWVNRQLEMFSTQYGLTGADTGLILAIEPGPEPLSAIEEWRNSNRGRRGFASTWTSRIGGLFSGDITDRPYCAARLPYFCESFSIPYDEASKLGMFEKDTPRPAWICFLTSDQHLISSFNESVRKRIQRHIERTKQVPLRVRIVNLPAMTVYTPIRWLIMLKYRSIDADLMHLDRRETLFRALIECRVGNQRRRAALLKELHKGTDQRWKRIWNHRPID